MSLDGKFDSGDLVEEDSLVIKHADMSKEMQDEAVKLAREVMKETKVEKDIASAIKKRFDTNHQPYWHCIVGRNFGSYVTHESKHFLYFYIGHVAVLLFKSA